MPETPDFDQIAERWCFNEETDSVPEMEERRAEFVVVLKSIWNARGAADVKALFETRDRMAVGDPLDRSRADRLERVIDDHLAPALRTLDR